MHRVLLLLLAFVVGCEPAATDVPDHSGPMTMNVEFVNPPGGETEEAPLPFSVDEMEVRIRVQAIGYDREVDTSFSGPVVLKVAPGELESTPVVQLTNGEGTADITISRAFGRARIWASDEGTDEEPGSYATGVSPIVHFDYPTCSQVQTSDSVIESPLEGAYVTIRGWDETHSDPRDLRVTAVTNDGFYVTDLNEPFGAYNSMFAFSFSRPDGIEVGMRLKSLSGIVEEFLGFTELAFPEWVVESQMDEPEVPLLPREIACDSPEMEKWESQVVTVVGVRSDFRTASDCNDYLEFGQWPAVMLDRRGYPVQCDGNDARINVVNANTVPSFGFPACESFSPPEEKELRYLTGILRHTRFASPPWILEVRNCLDFPEESRPADCVQQLANPLSGPRKAPQWAYRDIPACEGHLTHR